MGGVEAVKVLLIWSARHVFVLLAVMLDFLNAFTASLVISLQVFQKPQISHFLSFVRPGF